MNAPFSTPYRIPTDNEPDAVEAAHEVRVHGFHSEIYRDGVFCALLSWDQDGSRARSLVRLWEQAA